MVMAVPRMSQRFIAASFRIECGAAFLLRARPDRCSSAPFGPCADRSDGTDRMSQEK